MTESALRTDPSNLRPKQSCSRRGVSQRSLELPNAGLPRGRAGHHNDVARHKAWDERPEGLTELPSNAIPDDGAPDATTHTQTHARTPRRFPREMVQDELGPSHPLPFVQCRLEPGTGAKPILPSHPGSEALDGQALAAFRPAAAYHGPATRRTHALAEPVAPLTTSIVRLECPLHHSLRDANMQVIRACS